MKRSLIALALLLVVGLATITLIDNDPVEEISTSVTQQVPSDTSEVSQADIKTGIVAKQAAFEAASPEYPDADKIIYNKSNDGRFSPELHPADAQLRDILKTLAPTENTYSSIKEFIVYYDPDDDTLASVAAIDDINDDWSFEINYISVEEFQELAPSIVHEFAHILSLQNAQTTTDSEEAGIIDDCERLVLYEGCLNQGSYLDSFYNKFWKNTENFLGNTDRTPEQAAAFYESRQDQFVTDYATTNVVEDFAESFREYVMSQPPEGDTLKDQKIRFFEEYPELVSYRSNVRLPISNWGR